MTSSTKPLRVRQAEQVRDAITEAAVELLESGQGEQMTVPQVAEAAGVSLRTVYRYFPTREDVLAAAGQRAHERLGLRTEVYDVEDIVTSWWENSARVAAQPELGRALLYTAAGREARARQRERRVSAIAAAFAEIGRQLPAEQAARMQAVIAYLCGSGAFVAISDESGLSLHEARAAVRWALRTLLDAAETESEKKEPREGEDSHEQEPDLRTVRDRPDRGHGGRSGRDRARPRPRT